MRKALTVLVGLSVLLSGCSTVRGLLDREPESIDAAASDPSSTIQTYLGDVDRLLSDDAALSDRAWRELALDYERAPTTTNALRIALGLGTPGHSGTDLARADAMLTELLMKPELLLADEQTLARVHLALLRSRVSAEFTARQANSSATRNNERELAAARAQLQLLQNDNSRLRDLLTETEQKLAAITAIERSIRQRDDDNGGNTGAQDPNE